MTMSQDLTDLTKLVSIPLPALEVKDAPRRTAPSSGFNWKCIITGITLTEDLGRKKEKWMKKRET